MPATRSTCSFALVSALFPALLACSSGTPAEAPTPGLFEGAPTADVGDGRGARTTDDGSVQAFSDGGVAPMPPPEGPPCVPNPANFDIPDNACDDDGNGMVDDTISCDDDLLPSANADGFARALGLCQTSTGATDKKWGVVSAEYLNGHGSSSPPASGQHGILSRFGNVVRPREGQSLGVISSGWAREYDGATGKTPFKKQQTPMQMGPGGMPVANAGGGPPPGFPKMAAGCPAPSNVTYDLIDVKLSIKVPANAQGLKFDFDFYSGEWPEYVCSFYNDGFIAYLAASGFNGGAPGNISFDAMGNAVSVNNGFFDRCTPGTSTGCRGGALSKTSVCPGGVAELSGTGFDNPGGYCTQATSVGGGATGWLTSTAPVTPGEVITLDFMIWDTADPAYDSSVLLDHFRWVAVNVPKTPTTDRPPPPPPPK